MNEVKREVLICAGGCCISSDSQKVQAELQRQLLERGLDSEIEIIATGCHGFCEMGPLVTIYPEGVFYVQVKESDVADIVEQHLIGGNVVERLLYQDPVSKERKLRAEDIDFHNKQSRYVLAHCGHIDAEDINAYVKVGGYNALKKALNEMTPEGIIEEVKKAGLRGRGGGGYPTGVKWAFARHSQSDKKYIVCNADEGDPGAFMDRSVLEGDPHRLVEGMAIAAYAIGSDEGYVYVRAEYPLAIRRLKIAINQAMESGYLGDNIFGSGFSFHIHIKEGAGAFVCGEETALIASIEDKRGMPRPRPPYPAVSGLWGKPTNINNVETYANLYDIIMRGSDWYASIGTETSKGTKIFSLTGKVNNTGLAEVPMGTTMREIIFGIGGGIPDGKKFKAVQTGGPSGGCLPEELLDMPIDYDSLTKIGAMVGSGGLVVMDETTCMVDVAKFFLNFTQSESCGKCTPCREGTKRLLEILTRITDGQGKEGDIERLEELCYIIKDTALCGLGQTAPNPILSTIRYFRDEYEAHIKEKRCPAGVCNALIHYQISDRCKGCTLCTKVCPADAIHGAVKQQHQIDPEKCLKCGACVKKCPFKAIEKV